MAEPYTPTIKRVEDMYSWAVAWNASPELDERPDLVDLATRQRAEFRRSLAAHDRAVLEAFAARIDEWDALTFGDARQVLEAVIDAARAGAQALPVSEEAGRG